MKKKTVMLIIFALLSAALLAQAHGELNQIGDKKILQVWGNHQERGFAQGYFLAGETLQVINNYFYGAFCSNSSTVYNSLRHYFTNAFSPELIYQDEVQGMLAGIQAAGQSIYHSGLQRDLDATDILLANAIVDLNIMRSEWSADDFSLGCASISSWGTATAPDSLLAGRSVITRFLDWSRDDILIGNPVLIIHHPSEANEQKWISFTYPGLFGSLTAISEAQSYASLNMGNIHSGQNFSDLNPVLFSVRSGIERQDYNNSGTHDAMDIYDAVAFNLHRSGTIVHTLWELDDQIITGAIENNNFGTVFRVEQNSLLPAGHLLATNHFRVLYDPVCCLRYQNVSDSLAANPIMTAKRQLSVLSGAAGDYNNMMAIQYVPSEGRILWATATNNLAAYQAPALSLLTDELFAFQPTALEDEFLSSPQSFSIYPNPYRPGQKLYLKADGLITQIEVFNLKGQRLLKLPQATNNGSLEQGEAFRHLQNGIYFIKVSDCDNRISTRKLLILR
ncbi:MAG: T9SS type A sorting domain-containing protein [Candidatus Cloacimonetes bacterium]|nr:T9SS type A sorting domain-containing protein [Candidatus Cloacimonadota bacterium]